MGRYMSEIDWMQIFGENLQEIMDEKHISQRELARQTGLSNTAISNYVNAQKMPGLKAILNLSYVLRVDLHDLIDFGAEIR